MLLLPSIRSLMLYLLSLNWMRGGEYDWRYFLVSAEQALENHYLWGFGGLSRESFMLIYALLLRGSESDRISWKYCIQFLVLSFIYYDKPFFIANPKCLDTVKDWVFTLLYNFLVAIFWSPSHQGFKFLMHIIAMWEFPWYLQVIMKYSV